MGEEREQLFLPYKVLKTGRSAEIVEKKSRFIADLMPVQSEEEAAAFIESIRKKYWDARHHCSAFVIGDRGQLTRCNDDGEPSGTAGKPMLEVLLGQEVRNAVAVVTRYFGGTLLGTGGLVRAYTQAVQAGLEASDIVTMRYGSELELITDYNGIGKVQYILGQRGLEIGNSEYTDIVTLRLMVPGELVKELEQELTEATAGRIRIRELEKRYYEEKD